MTYPILFLISLFFTSVLGMEKQKVQPQNEGVNKVENDSEVIADKQRAQIVADFSKRAQLARELWAKKDG